MSKLKFSFKLLKEVNRARVGKIMTHRGNIDTPSFMPVGTLGTVKAVFIDDIIFLESNEVMSMCSTGDLRKSFLLLCPKFFLSDI